MSPILNLKNNSSRNTTISRRYFSLTQKQIDPGVVRPTTALQPQHDFFRKCCKTNGFSNILLHFRGAEFQQSVKSPYCPPEPLQSETCLGNILKTSLKLPENIPKSYLKEKSDALFLETSLKHPQNIFRTSLKHP